uniref:NADH-ubiquinone oxidoreductase chain 2 n=1 Tax=Adelphocoris lineolatus TaxID=236346 RepID=A0A0F6MY73_ADELI|nr:NADH dehydrogenase subunit 2 [Adelphocoris lineolatus]AHL44242.1 NADH dehydrogenase subunit 2 [Adelphocoris lineolatus]ANT45786.1 NADH dehydrogenase subunit 2 [Adelphocoris lineolatus]
MMKTSSKMLFFIMTMTSTMMVLSSNDMLNMWIGLEINLMSFIPLMYENKNNFLTQSSMMYFLIQSMASMMLIIMILMNMFMYINMWMETMNIIMLTMMMKMGMPPFHMWFPEMMSKMSWKTCIMLMTWQKVAPMYILSLIMNNNKLTMLIMMTSTIMGAILGLNHTSTQKIMAYSSINHMGWMMACASMNSKMWIMYMMMYSLMTIMLGMYMYKYNIMYINQYNNMSMNMTEKMSVMVMMLSMGGLPPFMGFMPKWITIEYMIMSNEFMLLTIMSMSSLITLMYYLRMISSTMLIMSHSQKWMFMNKKEASTNMLYINMLMPMLIILLNFM